MGEQCAWPCLTTCLMGRGKIPLMFTRLTREAGWYYCEWYWYLGWSETRFDLIEQEFRYGPIGATLAAKGLPADEILRTPRAVDEMHVVLRKRNLTDEECRHGQAMRGELRHPV